MEWMPALDPPRDLEVDNLSAGYPGRPVLQALSLGGFAAGRITALVGPNAAGKSTLLRALAGLIPAKGSVRLGGDELLRTSPRERAELVSFMPQALPDRLSLSVLESVISALRAVPIAGLRSSDVRPRALDVLGWIGIQDLAMEPLNTLSGGQRQLASLAQAVVRAPRVLLLDEPTSALDLYFQVVVMELMRAVAERGRVVVAVMHDINLATRWADDVVLLEQGTARAHGPPEEAITPEVLSDVYGVRCRVERCSLGKLQVFVDGRSR